MYASGDAGHHLFGVEDLLLHDQGTPQEQAEKQNRVVACLLEFASAISSLDGYMGIKLVRLPASLRPTARLLCSRAQT